MAEPPGASQASPAGQQGLKRPSPVSPHSHRLDLAAQDPVCRKCASPVTAPLPAPDADGFICLCADRPAYHLRCVGVNVSTASKGAKCLTKYLYLPMVAMVCPECSEERLKDALVLLPRRQLNARLSEDPAADTPATKDPELQELKAGLESVTKTVKELSDFLRPAAQPQDAPDAAPAPKPRPNSFAAAVELSKAPTGRYRPALPPQTSPFVASFTEAQEKIRKTELEDKRRKSAIIIAGLPVGQPDTKDAEQAAVYGVFAALSLPTSCPAPVIRRLPARGPTNGPPLLHVQFSDTAPARHLLSSSRELRNHPDLAAVFLRPERSQQQGKLIRLRALRAAELDSEDPEARHSIDYASPVFALRRRVAGRLVAGWEDPDFESWARSQASLLDNRAWASRIEAATDRPVAAPDAAAAMDQ